MIATEVLHRRFLECSGTSTDTRSIERGSLFFALKGPIFDANTFAATALTKGARYAVVDDPAVAEDERFLIVPDALQALQDLARHHRRSFQIPVIGITGSNGKTTTKELVHAVLSSTFPTLATIGNLNNHIGVPLTLLRLTAEHRFAIIEMGANKPGDIAELSAIAEPTHGLITNIGKAHLEGFGGFEGVLRTKTELYTFVRAHGGSLFVNADDPLLTEHAKGAQCITYGSNAGADTFGELAGGGPFLQLSFRGVDGSTRNAPMKLIGSYNLPNALAAIAIGQHFGVPDERTVEALCSYRPGNNRSQFTDTGRNHLILDAYNANPTSMAAALQNFASMSSDLPKLAILGDMLELGPTAAEEHRAIISLVRKLGIEAHYVGPQFAEVLDGHGAPAHPNADALLAALQQEPVRERLILLKASRGTKLETVVPVL
ncbi:MAG: UDP-N-acetylmuramoyl-tripeptide--D-alanyl-D-alanine ligase [Flavobacteriales bacterium]|nr:UDP-N-acetylmuramoyl-tripeptide--D-alanyl-D-alanine ligase [Flavobacteriales bacterium]